MKYAILDRLILAICFFIADNNPWIFVSIMDIVYAYAQEKKP